MSTPTFQNVNPYVYFTCNRDPTATEPDVAAIGIPSNWLFYWWNTTSKELFTFHGGASGSMVWKRDITPENIATYQIQADWNETNASAADYIKNKPTIPGSRSQSSATRSLNSAFQVSSTQWATVRYSVDISTTVSLSGGAVGRVVLEMATNSAFTTGVQELQSFGNGNTGTLVIGLVLTQLATASLSGDVPPGNYVRIRTVNTTGTPTFTYVSGQEILM